MKWIKKILFGLIVFFLVFIFIYNINNVIQMKFLKKDYSSFFGYTVLEVVSGSMEPTIHVGDFIVVKTDHYQYKENDIVTFYDVNGSFVTHRLISIQDGYMVTKGDANNTEDEKMPLDSIIGVYAFKMNALGTIFHTLKNPIVSVLIFVVGILMCYFMSMDDKPFLKEEEKEFQKFLKQKEKKEEKKKKGKNVKKKK